MRRAFLTTVAAALAGAAIVSAQRGPQRGSRVGVESGLTGAITPPLSPRNANYTITARLDPATRTITGSETITWRNITSTAAAELQFHLYWNAWKDARSTFMRERALGGSSDADRARTADEWARIEVTAIKVGGHDRTATKRFIAPDDDNPDDQTVMAVPLTEPIEPGATATIEIEWSAHVPRPFARTGAIGDFFFIVQWFPKLGVLQDDGWNCHQFHASTEFFSDFGVYDVSLTVPGGWPLGATGVEVKRYDEHRRHDDATGTIRRTSTISPGRPAPTTSSERPASSIRGCRPSRCACCCSRSMPRRPNATSTRRGPR